MLLCTQFNFFNVSGKLSICVILLLEQSNISNVNVIDVISVIDKLFICVNLLLLQYNSFNVCGKLFICVI